MRFEGLSRLRATPAAGSRKARAHGCLRAVLLLAALAPASAASAAGESACQRAEFRVLLDVGHTSEVPGAISARGVPEYEFNLSLARRIEQALVAAGFGRTVLAVTAGPARASLDKRVAQANGLPADLFLSIHHDSVPAKFLQIWEYGGAEQPYSDLFKGHSIFVSYENARRAASLAFGRLLGLQLKARGQRYTPHYTRADMGRRRRKLVDAEAGVYRFDKLIVLRTAAMPAVLLEAGSIINRDEEVSVGSPERQALVAAAVTRAVEDFCAARTGEKAASRKRPRMRHAAQPRVGGTMRVSTTSDNARGD
jgi:N-acetylmuramoyl-L-alanine amidase